MPETYAKSAKTQPAQLNTKSDHPLSNAARPDMSDDAKPYAEPIVASSPPPAPGPTTTGSMERARDKTNAPALTTSSPTSNGNQSTGTRNKVQQTLTGLWPQVNGAAGEDHRAADGRQVPRVHTLSSKERSKQGNSVTKNTWPQSTLRQPGPSDATQAILHSATLCMQCSKIITVRSKQATCVRCRAAHYCSEVCKRRHWSKHWPSCATNAEWCPKCGTTLENHAEDSEKCSRCQYAAYCSQACLNADHAIHTLQCPLHSDPAQEQAHQQAPQLFSTVPILPQPAGMRRTNGALIDNAATIEEIKMSRRRQGSSTDQRPGDKALGVRRCEDARDALVQCYKAFGTTKEQPPSSYLVKMITKAPT